MGRKLASIQKIIEIKEIENATKIEAVRINEWWLVVKKGEFLVRDLCVYIETDSWVPETIAPFLFTGREFNGVRGARLRTIKLRKQLSQGLVLPIRIILGKAQQIYEGMCLTELLCIQKWEKPIPAQSLEKAKGI